MKICRIHDPADVVPGRICGRPMPCRDHGAAPKKRVRLPLNLDGAVVSARFAVCDDNEMIELNVYCTAAAAGIDSSTDGSAAQDETPIRLTVRVYGNEGRAKTAFYVAAMGQTLRGALDGRQPKYIDYPEDRSTIRDALSRVAPVWEDWAFDASCQIEAELEASASDEDGSDEAWMAALEARELNVFGVGA